MLVRIFTRRSNLAYLTQGWKETSSKRRGFTKLIVRSGIPLSFTLQSAHITTTIRRTKYLHFNLQMTNFNQRETLRFLIPPNMCKNVRTVSELPSGFLKTLEPFLSQIAADIHISLWPRSNNLGYDCTPHLNLSGDMFNYLPPSSHIQCCRSGSGIRCLFDPGSRIPDSKPIFLRALWQCFG